jgi:hypothetical protein
MKPLLGLLIFLSPLISSSQVIETVEKIDQLVTRIDNMKFTDTVVINDTIDHIFYHNEKEIIGYLNKDTVLKTITRFTNSERVKIAYHRAMADYFNHIVLIREYDEVSSRLLSEIYLGYDSFYTWRHTILRADVFDRTPEDGWMYKHVWTADHSYEIETTREDRDVKKFDVIAEAAEQPYYTPPKCGDLPHAGLLKFRILESSDTSYAGQYRYFVIMCFSSSHRDLFKKGRKFKIRAATDYKGRSRPFPQNVAGEFKPEDASDRANKLAMLHVRRYSLLSD